MSETLQPGRHPDADMLSAFADGALPAHEREETLLHLAQCADCRGIVFLAQEAVEEQSPVPELAPQSMPLRRPWSWHWSLVSTAAAVLACVVLAFVYAPHFFSRGNEVASNVHAPTPTSESQTSPKALPPVDSNVHLAPRTSNKNEARAAEKEMAVNHSPAMHAPVLDGKAILGLPASGRPAATLSRQQQLPADSPGTVAGLGGRINAAPLAKAKSGVSVAKPNAGINAFASASSPAATLETATGGESQSVPAPALSAEAVPAQPIAQANGLTTVNAQAINDGALMKKAPAPQQQFNLPSHLETVSSISNAHLILAIDSAGKLFASRDAGLHWKAISPRWTGHAVKVNLASNVEQKMIGAVAGTGTRAAVAPIAPQAPIPNAARAAPANSSGSATLSGVVNDPTGAVISNAAVTVTNQQTAQPISVRTDDAGNYSFPNLAPGEYTVRVQSPGFKAQTIPGLQVAASEVGVRNIVLEIGTASQSVAVEASNSAMQTETPAMKATIEGQSLAATQPAVFQLTTDTGELWFSSDGRHWKRK
jgi:hypothetical protein